MYLGILTKEETQLTRLGNLIAETVNITQTFGGAEGGGVILGGCVPYAYPFAYCFGFVTSKHRRIVLMSSG